MVYTYNTLNHSQPNLSQPLDPNGLVYNFVPRSCTKSYEVEDAETKPIQHTSCIPFASNPNEGTLMLVLDSGIMLDIYIYIDTC